jgi:hypothetical protein
MGWMLINLAPMMTSVENVARTVCFMRDKRQKRSFRDYASW